MFSFLNKFKVQPKFRIVYNGHPALRQKAEPIQEITEDIRLLGRQLTSALLNSDVKGVGLAAPQIGISKRMIVIDTCPENGKPRAGASVGELMMEPRMPLVLINPEILDCSKEKEEQVEGCLSLPGVSGKVARPGRIVVKATTLDGENLTAECEGLLCRCLQHEIDHLDGVLFFDHLSQEEQKKNSAAMKQLAKEEKNRLAANSNGKD